MVCKERHGHNTSIVYPNIKLAEPSGGPGDDDNLFALVVFHRHGLLLLQKEECGVAVHPQSDHKYRNVPSRLSMPTERTICVL